MMKMTMTMIVIARANWVKKGMDLLGWKVLYVNSSQLGVSPVRGRSNRSSCVFVTLGVVMTIFVV